MILPKDSAAGLTEIAGVAFGVPVPLKPTNDGDVGALLTIETVPAALPVVVGANFTLKLADVPAATVAGVAIPLTA